MAGYFRVLNQPPTLGGQESAAAFAVATLLVVGVGLARGRGTRRALWLARLLGLIAVGVMVVAPEGDRDPERVLADQWLMLSGLCWLLSRVWGVALPLIAVGRLLSLALTLRQAIPGAECLPYTAFPSLGVASVEATVSLLLAVAPGRTYWALMGRSATGWGVFRLTLYLGFSVALGVRYALNLAEVVPGLPSYICDGTLSGADRAWCVNLVIAAVLAAGLTAWRAARIGAGVNAALPAGSPPG